MTCHAPQSPYPTDSVSALADIAKIQNAFQMLTPLMLINYLFPKQAKLKDGDKFDCLIVGGGTAGCVLANRLAAANQTVLMLEAGDDQPFQSFLPGTLIYLTKSALDWNYTAIPDKFTGRCHRQSSMAVPVGKVLGGTSAINFMLGSRGIINDYHQWATAANDSSWEYRNLLPYFKRSERLQAPKISNCATGSCRGVGGTPPDFGEEGGAGNIGIAQDNSTNIKDYLKAFAEMGNEIVQDLSGRHSVGCTRELYTIAEGYRQSTAYGYLVPARKNPNLSVSKNTIVTKIVFDKHKKAIGVKACIDGKKEIFLGAKNEVILSAGVIKSPQLLMLSGIGPKKHLEELNITVIADLPVDPQSSTPTDSVSTLADITNTQDAFKILTLLMLINYLFPKQAKLKNGDKFDFVIIGGGTAGCVLANRLAAANHTVLMLEAGDDQPFQSFLPGTLIYLPKSVLDWNYTAVPDKFTGRCHRHSSMAVPVGKVLGGTSSISFMLGFRGIVNDYHQWATAANDSSWEYRNLLPYFKRSERLQAPKISNCATGSCRGVGGTPPDFGEEGGAGNIGIAQDNSTNIKDYIGAFEEMGNEIVQDLSGRHSMGYTRGLLTIAEGYRQSTAYGYLVPARKYPNLSVSKNTIVTKIVFDKHKKAIGIKACIDGKKEIFLGAKKEVILSAGVVKSPQLLMLSGVGPKKHLEEMNITVISDLPVGENFQDQQVVTVMHRAKRVTDPGPFDFHTYPASAVVGYKSLEPCAGIPEYATFTFVEERLHYLLQFCALPFDFQYEICDRSYQQLMGRQNAYTQIVNLYPKSRGKVTLNTSNPHDAPLIDTGYFSKDEDMESLVKYVKDFLPIVNTTYFKEVNGSILDPIGDKCRDFKYGTDDYWKCYVYCMSTSMWNYGGTCSMGSVVDSKLKVIGVKGLRVVDASVMPIVITGGNYVATIVIAEKASDMIKEEHQGN